MKQTAISILAIGALTAAGTAFAADKKASFDPGKREYMNSCAACHGANGKVQGLEVAGVEFLKKTPADLSTLSKRNGGVFPFERVYAVIDGRETVGGHGSRDMPIWGERYSQDKVKAAEYYVDVPYDMEMYVRTRILSLIDYIHRLQAR